MYALVKCFFEWVDICLARIDICLSVTFVCMDFAARIRLTRMLDGDRGSRFIFSVNWSGLNKAAPTSLSGTLAARYTCFS